MGGEKLAKALLTVRQAGSPPRGRGKAPAPDRASRKSRITPAWAGKRAVDTVSRCAHWDHPRVGGEKGDRQSVSAKRVGSPPHGRGKAGSGHCHRASRRITPAWAGKRGRPAAGPLLCPDHPRMGGEKPFLFCGGSSDSGSPPHGRGKASPARSSWAAAGITPAWAEKRGS